MMHPVRLIKRAWVGFSWAQAGCLPAVYPAPQSSGMGVD